MRSNEQSKIWGLLPGLLVSWFLIQAGVEINRVAWGTGEWLGEYSPLWAFGFFAYILFSLGLAALTFLAVFSPRKLDSLETSLVRLRSRLGIFRWVFAGIFLLIPVWLFQYTSYGVVFIGTSFRLVVWVLSILGLAFWLARSESFLPWKSLLVACLLSGVLLCMAIPLVGVTSYPFSLGWSEGNRLWDYSILFGSERYIIPPGQKLTPFLDVGRQLSGGLPFLIPGLTIFQERLWLGLMGILPYILLGLCVFYIPKTRNGLPWILAGLWGFIFLRQGPVHTPLLFSAALVALAWRRPLWLSIPLIAAAGYFAAVSRFTWTFAPGMWAGMLWLAGAQTRNGRIAAREWWRAVALGLGGLIGGYLLPQLTGLIAGSGNASVTQVAESMGRQPLLWYRLLPNSTYDLGILINLVFAVTPLILLLLLAVRSEQWILTGWQKLAILGVLAAFLVVGLVASTKIGGGGDLHNMDMFLISLLFAAGLAWEKMDRSWLTGSGAPSRSLQFILVVLVTLPAFGSLLRLRPLLYADDFTRLKILTDIVDPYVDSRVLGLLPPRSEVDDTLSLIRDMTAHALETGEVLFMDQRQLLTFGFVQDVPLVAEYEKKYLMDQAMGDTAASTFPPFYRDLERHRFSLIISDPLHLPIKDSEFGFSEENNAWVKWVAAPILCYYEPLITLQEFKIELLVPLPSVSPDCMLPDY
jgi:hypothetical protein